MGHYSRNVVKILFSKEGLQEKSFLMHFVQFMSCSVHVFVWAGYLVSVVLRLESNASFLSLVWTEYCSIVCVCVLILLFPASDHRTVVASVGKPSEKLRVCVCQMYD